MQAPLARILAVLDRHGALDGVPNPSDASPGVRLRDDIHLVSIGDHVDFGKDVTLAAVEGLRVLDWLAGHPSEQVTLLLGNHDAARVIELAGWSNARFSSARAAGKGVLDLEAANADPATLAAAGASFSEAFPDAVTPALVARDYASYTEA